MLRNVPPTVRRLGWVSFFTDAAAEMVYPLLPALLRSFGMASVWLGAMEGTAEALSAFVKWQMGGPTDRAGSKKPFVVAGYALANLVRPLIAIASAGWHVLLIRSLDRIGKGVRTVPRDALLAESVDEKNYATAFAFHRAMDNAGSVLGPILAFALFRLFELPVRSVIALAIVPGLVSLAVLIFGVREESAKAANANVPKGGEGVSTSVHEGTSPAGAADAKTADATSVEANTPDARTPDARTPDAKLSPDLVRYLAIFVVFTMGASADSFLLLRAFELGLPESQAPLLWLALSASKAASNVPGGYLADRLGRRTTLAVAWLVYAIVYATIPFVQRLGVLELVIVAYGAYYGLGEGAERAILAERAAPAVRGRAFARMYALTGIAVLPANLAFGALYKVRPLYAFGAGAACAFIAAILLLLLVPAKPTRGTPAATAA